MSKKWRKVVSLLMAVFMIQSLISVSVFATETETQSDDSGSSEPYYVVSGANNKSDDGTYRLNKNEKGKYDLKEALNKVGAKGAATGFAKIDVYDATIEDFGYPNGTYAMQNLEVTLHNCTVNTWGFQIGCAKNVTWKFVDCVFLQNMIVMYDGGTTAPIDFDFEKCNFNGKFTYQGNTVGDMIVKDCQGLNTINIWNAYPGEKNLEKYQNKNSKGEPATLSITGCTYVPEKNGVNELLAFGGSFINYEFKNNKWSDGSDIYIKSYAYKTWYKYKEKETDPAVTDEEGMARLEKDGTKLDTESGKDVSYKSDGTNIGWHVLVDGYKVAHVQGLNANGTPNIVNTEDYAIKNNATLTDKVSNGYLYGGAFTDANCTTPAFEDGAACTGFKPSGNTTYYIWEVDQKYLVPKTASVWRHSNGGAETVTQLYLMTVVDRLLYKEVGFDMSNNGTTGTGTSQKDGTEVAYGLVNVTANGKLAQQMYVKNGLLNITTSGVAPDDHDAGYIGMYKLKTDEFSALETSPVTFKPYWVTLDGVKVTGVKERTCTYQTSAKKVKISDTNVTSVNQSYTAASTQNLTFVDAYSYNADPDGVDTPEKPVDPVDPPTEDNIVVTVNDNGSVYDVTAKSGDDLAGQISYAGVSGKLFAGWFTDKDYKHPADLSNVEENMTVYAKYVSDAFLRFKFVQQHLTGSDVILFTALDSKDYKEVGFVVNDKMTSANYIGSQYSKYSARVLFGSGVGRNAKLVVGRSSIGKMHRGDKLTITPYWITKDGTTVYGTKRTLTYGWFGLK